MHRRLSPEAIPPLFLLNKGLEFEAPRSIFGFRFPLNSTLYIPRFSQLHTLPSKLKKELPPPQTRRRELSINSFNNNEKVIHSFFQTDGADRPARRAPPRGA